MRAYLIILGFMIFALGIILSLPAMVIDASKSPLQTNGQAMSFIMGNVVKQVSSMKDAGKSPLSFLHILPVILILVGLALMLIAIILHF
jgi:hypothetical protein